METKSRKLSDFSSGIGFILSVFAAWALIYRDGFEGYALVLLALGCTLMLLGLWFYLRAKGYNPAWAFLVFLFGPMVVVLFFFLPDQKANDEKPT